jgi:hypothetical protein
MSSVSISDARAQGLEGVAFVATAGGVSQQFIVTRESLEDLEYAMLESAEALLQAFKNQQQQVLAVVAKALQQGPTGPAPITLQSLLA